MSSKRQTVILTTVGVAVIMLVIGVAIGSVAFPMTKTETTTQLSSVTTTVTQNLISQTTIYTNASSSLPTVVTKVGATAPNHNRGCHYEEWHAGRIRGLRGQSNGWRHLHRSFHSGGINRQLLPVTSFPRIQLADTSMLQSLRQHLRQHYRVETSPRPLRL